MHAGTTSMSKNPFASSSYSVTDKRCKHLLDSKTPVLVLTEKGRSPDLVLMVKGPEIVVMEMVKVVTLVRLEHWISPLRKRTVPSEPSFGVAILANRVGQPSPTP